VGGDFALGRARSGNVPRLRELGRTFGFDVDALPLHVVGGAPVTSTRIRALLNEGRVAEARELLGRAYGFRARVVGGDRVGRTLGFPTANLRLHDEQHVPAHGIYAVWARIADEDAWRMGAMSVGVRPTFGGGLRTLEVFLLDWSGDLYGQDLTISFADWLRPEREFAGTAPLVAAMAADVEHARRRLTALGPPPD
jgi:riboflavin kinase/FMN adenylyltransferase